MRVIKQNVTTAKKPPIWPDLIDENYFCRYTLNWGSIPHLFFHSFRLDQF